MGLRDAGSVGLPNSMKETKILPEKNMNSSGQKQAKEMCFS